jgi:hypothetical protein
MKAITVSQHMALRHASRRRTREIIGFDGGVVKSLIARGLAVLDGDRAVMTDAGLYAVNSAPINYKTAPTWLNKPYDRDA